MKNIACLFSLITLLLSCHKTKETSDYKSISSESVEWYHMDYHLDTVPGISLEKAYKELVNENDGKEIIVAVIDSRVNINHEDLASQIYVNSKEIPNNNIDDDENGYSDDINGWNFLGYGPYESLKYAFEDHTRTLKRLSHKFNGKEVGEIDSFDKDDFTQYQEASKLREVSIAEAERVLWAIKYYRERYFRFKELFSDRFPFFDGYTKNQLDTVKTNNEEEVELVGNLKLFVDAGLNLETLDRQEKEQLIQRYTSNNLNYNDRLDIGDDPYDYDDIYYGNNYLNAPQNRAHGTQVSGIIAAARNNGKGINGVSNKIKLLIIPISPLTGQVNDKDFFNAVKYAVDNGARVINYSNGKHYADKPNLIFNALKYAENNDVLFITSAGNEGKDLDDPGQDDYPKDKSPDGSRVANLIKVGASSKYDDQRIYASFSDYGKENVDIFAPGKGMRSTTTLESQYQDDIEGTSLSSALTSGVAALVMSHYPNLSSIQVKQILMDSGIEYKMMIKLSENDSVPFNDLSKSGKVLNAYNALKMAEEISKNKK